MRSPEADLQCALTLALCPTGTLAAPASSPALALGSASKSKLLGLWVLLLLNFFPLGKAVDCWLRFGGLHMKERSCGGGG